MHSPEAFSTFHWHLEQCAKAPCQVVAVSYLSLLSKPSRQLDVHAITTFFINLATSHLN